MSARLQGPRSLRAAAADSARFGKKKAQAEDRWPEALIDAARAKIRRAVQGRDCGRATPLILPIYSRDTRSTISMSISPIARRTRRSFSRRSAGFRSASPRTARISWPISGNDDLLREICDAAEFVAVETDYSRGADGSSAARIGRQDPSRLQRNGSRPILSRAGDRADRPGPVDDILSVGRLRRFQGVRDISSMPAPNYERSSSILHATSLATDRCARNCRHASATCGWIPSLRFAGPRRRNECSKGCGTATSLLSLRLSMKREQTTCFRP